MSEFYEHTVQFNKRSLRLNKAGLQYTPMQRSSAVTEVSAHPAACSLQHCSAESAGRQNRTPAAVDIACSRYCSARQLEADNCGGPQSGSLGSVRPSRLIRRLVARPVQCLPKHKYTAGKQRLCRYLSPAVLCPLSGCCGSQHHITQ